LVAVRGLGKREAVAKLKVLEAQKRRAVKKIRRLGRKKPR
jgi:hypothetical protein